MGIVFVRCKECYALLAMKRWWCEAHRVNLCGRCRVSEKHRQCEASFRKSN